MTLSHHLSESDRELGDWEGKKLLKDIFCILCGCVLCAECCKILNIKGITNHCNWHYQFVDIILLWTRSHHPCKPMAHYIYLMFTRDNERKNKMKYFRILLFVSCLECALWGILSLTEERRIIWLSDLLSSYRSKQINYYKLRTLFKTMNQRNYKPFGTITNTEKERTWADFEWDQTPIRPRHWSFW